MNEPRRHHLVPESFLLRFADADGRLRAVRRDGSGSFPAHVSKIAVERDFYRVEVAGEPSYEVEQLLGKTFDADAKGAVDRVLNGAFPLRGDDRATLAYYVALQYLRGADMRVGFAAIQDTVLRSVLAVVPDERVVAAFRARNGRAPSETELTDLRRAWSKTTFELHPNEAVRGVFEKLDGLARIALARRWVLVRVPQPMLLTSDAPVVCCSAPTSPGGASFGTADQIRLSLDRSHVLVLSWDERVREGVLPAPEGYGVEQNRFTAMKGYRHYFQHPEDPPLAGPPLPAPRLPLGPASETDGPR